MTSPKPECATAGTGDATRPIRRTAALAAYWQMMKPTIGLLVVVTVVPSLFMAAATLPDTLVALSALVGTFLASSSAGIFNHLVDSDIDGTMRRTRKRPMPAGKARFPAAFALAVVLAALAFAILYFFTTPLAAWLSLAANFFYVVIYTIILKRRTVQNIVIGGAAGAVGPLIGWAAVTGELSVPAWLLFLIVFLWTPPHFWALAIKYKDDYSAAKVPMLPSVKGDEVTRKQIFLYALTLLPVVGALWAFGYAGPFFGVLGLMLTGRFAWMSYRLYRDQANELAMPIFFFSLIYIFGIFGVLTFDRVLGLLTF